VFLSYHLHFFEANSGRLTFGSKPKMLLFAFYSSVWISDSDSVAHQADPMRSLSLAACIGCNIEANFSTKRFACCRPP